MRKVSLRKTPPVIKRGVGKIYHKKSLYLILVMVIITMAVTGITIYLLYTTAFKRERTRLVEIAQSQARVIEAVARFDTMHSHEDHLEGSFGATLSQIRDAHKNYRGFGKTGEFTLARLEGDNIVFLLSHRHNEPEEMAEAIPLSSELAEPMKRALKGRSGTVIGLDYRGAVVLAAHEPVAEINLGIVAKIDLAEIRSPFIRAGMIATGSAVLLIIFGAALFLRITNPLIRRLEESEAETRAIVETAVSGIIVVDNRYLIELFNPAAERIFGYSNAEVMGRSIEMLIPESSYSSSEKDFDDYLSAAKGKFIGAGREAEGRRKDGTTFPMEMAISEMYLGKRQMYVGMVTDITDRKEAGERIRNGEERLSKFMDSDPDAFFLFDPELDLVDLNKAASRLFGMNKEEVVGKNILELSPGIKKTGRYDKYLEVIKTGKPFSANDLVPHPKFGNTHLVLKAFKVGEGLGYIVTDITEIKKAEEELREALSIKSAFTSTVSHELRTPLAAIKEGIGIVLDGSAGGLMKTRKIFSIRPRGMWTDCTA